MEKQVMQFAAFVIKNDIPQGGREALELST